MQGETSYKSQTPFNSPLGIKGEGCAQHPVEDDGEPFQDKMSRLTSVWREQSAETRRSDGEIEANLASLGFWIVMGRDFGWLVALS